MHELSIVKRFMNIAISSIPEGNTAKVKSVTIDVGEMTDLVPRYLTKYYDLSSKDTILEGSELIIHSVPMKVLCHSCGCTYNPMLSPRRLCPECGSGDCHLLEGRDVSVSEITLEESSS